jgi:hypothetical protein
MEMLLLAHKVTLELTFSTQHKVYGLNPQISQREGWGEPLRLRALLEMAWDLSNITRNNNPPLKKVWGIYTTQRRKLAVGPRVAPVRPVFEKLAVGLAAPVRPVPLTGQTGQARDTPKNPFLRN